MLRILLFLFAFSVFARQEVFLGQNKDVSVLSDKAFRRSSSNTFEAIGNVIITKENETLYGESAILDMAKSNIEVEGNVRFTTKQLTMYGAKIDYQIDKKTLSMENARIYSSAFSVYGEKISKTSDTELFAINAEFTSCKDCPESWSVYGEEVRITIGDYIRVKGAIIKVNGVAMLYLPYFIFPIKSKRQTGLLFPKFYSSTAIDGVIFKQPYFWAISQNKDLTFSPAIFGDRGPGVDFEYRHVFGDDKWLDVNNLSFQDEIYNPAYIRGDTSSIDYNRYFLNLEGHFKFSRNINSHFIIQDTRDYDILRDIKSEIDPYQFSPELGSQGFIEGRTDLLNFSLQGTFLDNPIINDPREFDHEYVQILPKASLSFTPYNFFQHQGWFLSSANFGAQGDVTKFKQNRPTDDGVNFIRNADRINVEPFLDINTAYWGPFQLKTRIAGDYQNYKFPELTTDSKFQKWYAFVQNEIKFEVDRIYGLAYQKEVDQSKLQLKLKQKEKGFENVIGYLPSLDVDVSVDKVIVKKNSYRHGQVFRFIHLQEIDSNETGNQVFQSQIQSNSGLFDYRDAIRRRDNELENLELRKEIPKRNSLEFRWENTLIKKSSRTKNTLDDNQYLTDNFDYQKVFYINLSQGLDLQSTPGVEQSFSDKLTRLAVEIGLTLDNLNLSAQEFYFYDGTHITDLNINSNLKYFDIGSTFTYSSVATASPISNLRVFSRLRPNEVIELYGEYNLDLRSQDANNIELYSIGYRPRNNCWSLSLSYLNDAIETRYGIDFQLLFNNDFNGLF